MTKHTPKIGDSVHPDEWKLFSVLESSDEFFDSSFKGCQFRILSNKDTSVRYAVNISVTGKDHCICVGRYRCRCRVEFVGDGEPSTFSGAWLYHS